MEWLRIHGEFQDLLAHHGLRRFEDFFHHDGGKVVRDPPRRRRSVVRFELDGVGYFLKREHTVWLRDRFRNWVSGAGMVSKSRHEWNMLHRMLLLGLHCPEPVAVGEVESQAFLLLRELSGCVDLKSYLMQHPNLNWPARLGRYLSRVHDAGFWHRDLFVSHVFVDPMTLQFSLIDLQRCQHHARVSWQHRVRDLAALHASLAPTLASPADFQHCIRAYLDDAGLGNIGRLRSRFHVEIERRSCHLLKRSKFQEMRMTAPKVYLRSFALPGDDFERARSQRTEVIGFLQKGADA